MMNFVCRLRLVVRVLGRTLIAAALVMPACAVKKDQPRVESVPPMTAAVLALYNEGAAVAQAGDLQQARQKYEAALEKARVLRDERGIGASLTALGSMDVQLQWYAQALESLTAALLHHRRTKSLAGEAVTLMLIGAVHAQMGNDMNALEAVDQGLMTGETALGQASEHEKPLILQARAQALLLKGDIHNKAERWREATQGYRQAATVFREMGNHEMAGRALWAAGDILRLKLEAPQEATGIYAEAWPLLEDAGKVADATWVRLRIGGSHTEAGHFQEAVAVLSDVITVAKREAILELVIRGNAGLASAYEGLGDFEQALAHYQSALQPLKRGEWKGEPTLEPEILLQMGKIHRLLGRYEEAIEHFRAVAVGFRKAREPKAEAGALTQLAEIFFWLLDYKTAIHYYKQALDIYTLMGNLPKQIEVLAGLGEASTAANLSEEGPVDESQGYFEEGVRLLDILRKAAGQDPLTALKEGVEEWHKRAHAEADQRRWRGLQGRGSFLTPEYLEATGAVSSYLEASNFLRQRWQQAGSALTLEYLMAAGILYQKVGRTLLAMGRPKQAIVFLTAAHLHHAGLPQNRDLVFEWAKNWYFLAEAYRQETQLNLALQYLRMAEVLATLLRTPEIHWVYSKMAGIFRDQGNIEGAVAFGRKALEGIESVRRLQGAEDTRMGVLEGALYVYRGFVALLLDIYKQTGDEQYRREAFQYIERGRARAFLDMLDKSRATRLGGEVGWLVAKQEEIRRKMVRIHQQLRSSQLETAEYASLLDRLERLRESWKTLQREAAQQSPRYEQIVFPRPVTVEELQSTLEVDTILLEYSTGPERSTLWAISKDSIHAYTLPDQEGVPILEQYLKTLREPLMGADEMSKHMVLGQQLYQGLIEPAEEQIRGKKHLIIAPDGPLYYLPFEALILPGSQESARAPAMLADVPYLVKQFRVTYVPSASVLVMQRMERGSRAQKARLPLVAFGDPVYHEVALAGGADIPPGRVAPLGLRGASFRRLEFSSDEVRRIARIWNIPLDAPHINLREMATVDRVRELNLSQYRMLHFATHAVLGDEIRWATQPALVLSQQGRQGKTHGLLQFSDILDLQLNAELVVLSACETGLGRLRDGEGIVGLSRAFFYAGASAVVVSLWRVEDQSTSLLMEHFYRHMKQGLSKANALRQAKLDILGVTIDLKVAGTRQSLASPFYWAPFILVGNGD